MDPAKIAAGIDDVLRAELDALAASGLHRARRPAVVRRAGPRLILEDGSQYLSFCGNDYLGLHDHPAVKQAAVAAIERWGAGATASRLITGELEVHRALEAALAVFTGAETATVFPSGFQANLGLVGALAGKGDVVFSDARNHASLIEACRACRATVRVFRHADPDHLEQLLKDEPQRGRRVVLTDAVFSMTGGVAPIPEMLAACERHDAWLCIDEAHSTGVLGDTGRGVAEYFGLEPDRIAARVVTFGKALGGQGAAVVGGAPLADAIRNRGRAFVYTTALAPASAAAAQAALEQIATDPQRVETLRSRARAVRVTLREAGAAAVTVAEAPTPIVPVVAGSPERAMALAASLQAHGVLVVGIRPPTVPDGEAGLRLTVSTTHTQQDLEQLGAAFRAALAATPGLGQNEPNTRRQP